jgi:hypothetical protein
MQTAAPLDFPEAKYKRQQQQIIEPNKALWDDMSFLKIISNEKGKCGKQSLLKTYSSQDETQRRQTTFVRQYYSALHNQPLLLNTFQSSVTEMFTLQDVWILLRLLLRGVL